jgi:hypothetical protein
MADLETNDAVLLRLYDEPCHMESLVDMCIRDALLGCPYKCLAFAYWILSVPPDKKTN